MENGFGDNVSRPGFIPMKRCEIDQLTLPPLNDENWQNLDQPRPKPISEDVVARWMDLEQSNLDGRVNENQPFTSCIDPQLLTWEYNQPYQPPRTPDPAPQYVDSGLYQPSSTPEPAPHYGDGLTPLEYHTKRAEWHRVAEQFHRDQARDLAFIVQLFDSPESVSQQPIQGMCGKNNREFATNGGAVERFPLRNVLGSVPQQPIQGMGGKSNREFASNGGAMKPYPTRNISGSVSQQPIQGSSGKSNGGFASNGGAVERSPSRYVLPKAANRGLKTLQYQRSRISTNGRSQKLRAHGPKGFMTGTKVSNNSPKRPIPWKNYTPATFRDNPPSPYTRPM
ncbi:hypothetical protein G7Y79_00068g096090 [Physcia stellaris]|nr:hypothetical protein G7Y79_00068g096090 [Physcia stellaris]